MVVNLYPPQGIDWYFMSFLIDKHEKFFNRCLIALPSKVQSEDSNQLALIYFCLHGLGLINRLKLSPPEQKFYREYIVDSYLLEIDEFQGFRSTNYYKKLNNSYDLPNISSTFFGLINLLILKYDYSKVINRQKIVNFLQKCQIKSGDHRGSFAPTIKYDATTKTYIPFGEPDLRICYMAMCICQLIKYDGDEIDKSSIIQFITTRINYQGGLSSDQSTESHLGFTFCGLAALKLLNVDLSTSKYESTLDWLIHRQVDYTPPTLYDMEYPYYQSQDQGSYNGRENKFGDTCYSWWCTASLTILNPTNLELTNLQQARDYLLQITQNGLVGGFAKDYQANPDPFHSFLAIASLSLWNAHFDEKLPLEEIDNVLVIPKSCTEWLSQINW